MAAMAPGPSNPATRRIKTTVTKKQRQGNYCAKHLLKCFVFVHWTDCEKKYRDGFLYILLNDYMKEIRYVIKFLATTRKVLVQVGGMLSCYY